MLGRAALACCVPSLPWPSYRSEAAGHACRAAGAAMIIKKADRAATLSFCPSGPFLAAGSCAGGLSADFDSTSKLEASAGRLGRPAARQCCADCPPSRPTTPSPPIAARHARRYSAWTLPAPIMISSSLVGLCRRPSASAAWPGDPLGSTPRHIRCARAPGHRRAATAAPLATAGLAARLPRLPARLGCRNVTPALPHPTLPSPCSMACWRAAWPTVRCACGTRPASLGTRPRRRRPPVPPRHAASCWRACRSTRAW